MIEANDKREDFRFSGFSLQELHCFNFDEDLNESCKKAVKAWDHMSVLFTNHSIIAFKYDTEFHSVSEDNPLTFPKGVHEFQSSKFWPTFETRDTLGLGPHYLSALFDPKLEVLFVGI